MLSVLVSAFWVRLLALCFLNTNLVVSAYIGVTFSANGNIYGPDGPWYAIEVQVWSSNNNSTEPQKIQLMPGSTSGRSLIPLAGACGDVACKGGELNGSFIAGSPQRVQENGTTTDNSFNYTVSGLDTYFDISDGSSTDPVWNNILTTAYDTSVVKYPSGRTSTLQLGWLALGGPTESSQTSSGQEVFNVPGSLAVAGITNSWSYFLHFGSVALQYPAGLMFGGYDKGRVIGPAARMVAGGFNLLDISIDTETGGSPFSYGNRSGLLQGITGNIIRNIPIYVIVDEPYIYLPYGTCRAIVQSLPVYLQAGYYLWNTSDPNYEKIITSPAYLGFSFAPSGDSGEVMIKVPFRLLNLTLESEASGLASSVAYLPIQPYDGGPTNTYAFGRAFLQAATYIQNMNPNAPTAWLGQAPGPGATGQGLGAEPRDIEASDTDLDFYSEPTLFAESWKPYWTPLPMPTVDDGTNTNSSASARSSSPMSTSGSSSTGALTPTGSQTPLANTGSRPLSIGTIAGIAIGSAALVVLTACGIAFLMIKQRKAKVLHHTPSNEVTYASEPNAFPHPELDPSSERGELPGYRELGELEERRIAMEMPGGHTRYEMPATPVYIPKKRTLYIDTRKE